MPLESQWISALVYSTSLEGEGGIHSSKHLDLQVVTSQLEQIVLNTSKFHIPSITCMLIMPQCWVNNFSQFFPQET